VDHCALVVLLVRKCFALVYRWIHYTTDESHLGSLSDVGVSRLERPIKVYRSTRATQTCRVFWRVKDILVCTRSICTRNSHVRKRVSVLGFSLSVGHHQSIIRRNE